MDRDELKRDHLAAYCVLAYIKQMAKLSQNGSTGRFSVAANGKGSPMTIRDSASGKVLELKGYGALSGEYAVRKGIDLSKPIAAQAAKVDKKTIAPRKPA